ncbi:molybdenum cofactor biosynthesis protein B [Salinisphaera sp. USBA-960]|uniref:molybdenum cofactor biosynthesis protein B n=1 Tax=Salinisphaera orenii TaxID=856731 RepID=UPI000DBE3B9E|nr:molybdenum cofactor biosynthesis protein B [Salifodinibacter halophilus]NNC27093.1 molybdenum cofactor biosynthesis protein B [Salifodinibacter halophilus]
MPESFVALNIAVLTVSNTRSEADDKSGALLTTRLKDAGHLLHEKAICADDLYEIRARVARWIANERPDVVITTGGTGLTGDDVTPEAITPLLDRTIDGFGEMFRVLSHADIGSSTLQSRSLAGVAKATFVFCLPGSSGACADGWDKLIAEQIDARTAPCNLHELLPRLPGSRFAQ